MQTLIPMLALSLFLISCEKKEAKAEAPAEAENPYSALIEKAKQTEALLQKQADSIIKEQDSLGMPR